MFRPERSRQHWSTLWSPSLRFSTAEQDAERSPGRGYMDRDPKLGGNDFGYGSPDSGFRSMTANLQCTDTHFFPKHPSPGFASRAPKIMPVEGNSYPNLQKGLHAKPNVLYGNWQIPEILPRDPARPDIEHFLQLEARKSPPAYAYKDTPQHPVAPQPDAWDTKNIQLRDTTPLERHGTVMHSVKTSPQRYRVAFGGAHRSRFELRGTQGAAVQGADSLNLSPDVYNSHRYTTLAKAVEQSKRYKGFSKSIGHQSLNSEHKFTGPQQPYAGALLHNTVEEVTMPDKPGNPCASAFKSDTQRFKYEVGISQGLLYEPDVGAKSSIVAGIRASPVKFSGFNSHTTRFIYPQPSNYPAINSEVGPNASLATAMQDSKFSCCSLRSNVPRWGCPKLLGAPKQITQPTPPSFAEETVSRLALIDKKLSNALNSKQGADGKAPVFVCI